MRMITIGLVLAGALAGAGIAGGAQAGTNAGAKAGDGAEAADGMPVFGAAVSDADLATQNGRQGIPMLGEGSIQAILNNNTVSGGKVRTGDNTIGDQAFQNYSGIGSVLVNSGNNVIMNNLTIVNVALQ